MERDFYVYMLASGRNGTLYIGVTSDLLRRAWEHKSGYQNGFSKRYGVDRLVWYCRHASAEAAIRHEKRLKEWRRAWKIELIETTNPYWRDLYDQIHGRNGQATGFRLSPE